MLARSCLLVSVLLATSLAPLGQAEPCTEGVGWFRGAELQPCFVFDVHVGDLVIFAVRYSSCEGDNRLLTGTLHDPSGAEVDAMRLSSACATTDLAWCVATRAGAYRLDLVVPSPNQPANTLYGLTIDTSSAILSGNGPWFLPPMPDTGLPDIVASTLIFAQHAGLCTLP